MTARPRSRRVRVVMAVGIGLAVVVGLGACADDELTRAEYVERADAVCADANERISELDAPDASDPAAVADAINEIVEVQRGEVEELEQLLPARDDRDVVREWLEGVRGALDASDAAADALRDNDPAAATQLVAEADAAAAMADEKGAMLGLEVCMVPVSGGGGTPIGGS